MNSRVMHPKSERVNLSSTAHVSGLAAMLARLDARIQAALKQLPAVYGSDTEQDPFRGMHISSGDVQAMLAREPGQPLFVFDPATSDLEGEMALDRDFPRLAWLGRQFSLSVFDLDVVILALAPEVDLRYERLYAYLQDDVSHRLPSIELALNLLCADFDEKLTRRAHFAGHAPLIKNDILHITPDPTRLDASYLTQNMILDAQIAQFLLGLPGLDPRLGLFCEMVSPVIALHDLPFPDDFKQSILALLEQSLKTGQPVCVYFQGSQGCGSRQLAAALASEIGRDLLAADLSRIPQNRADFASYLKLLFRQAWFDDAIIFIEGFDELIQKGQESLFQSFQEAMKTDGHVTLLVGEMPWRSMASSTEVIQINLEPQGSLERKAWWLDSLSRAGVQLDPAVLQALADRFRLSTGQINAAVTDALGKTRWRQVQSQKISTVFRAHSPDLSDLFAAARAQTGHELAQLAQKIQPRYSWEALVLPEDSLAQLHELCQWVYHQSDVLEGWGFERKLSLGKGATALFAGVSGTGKTMAAEVVANELGLDIYRINLATVISKYIGETEKNLERIFKAAENANAILFFDEADALFGKRSEVRDSHDRYANVEISYLLQQMEQYTGVAILCSNLRHNLDDAFTRRLAFIISFPFPDEAHRRRIWRGVFPVETPIDEAVNLGFMARQFNLSGGNIKNIALSAAYLAAANGGIVKMDHLLHATRREYQKLGKTLSDAELSGECQVS